MKTMIFALIPLLIGLAFAMTLREGEAPHPQAVVHHDPKGSESLVVAGGCFWCTESLFELVKGVYSVEAAYVGGSRPGVTYEQVCSGTTGHAEAIRIVFDPKVVDADDLLRLFFTVHDPTTKNQQGGDVGTQYRSAIFYSTPEEKARAERIIHEIDEKHLWPNPIVTTVEPIKNYTRAEEYHQNYYEKYERASPAERAKMNSGYCQAVIAPKVLKFREHFKRLLKDGG